MDPDEIIAEYSSRQKIFADLSTRMLDLLRHLLSRSEIRVQSIEGRVKSRESLQKKLTRPGPGYSALKEVTDICGLRIITFFAADVDKVAEILRQEFEIDSTHSTDRRVFTDPDRFGYQSLHYVIALKPARTDLAEYQAFRGYQAEVQVRTVIQHAWAEIEHDLGYKSDVAVPKTIRRRLFRLAAMLEIADDQFTIINETQKQYRLEVKQQLKTNIEDVKIDATSVGEFAKTDETATTIDQEICTGTKRTLKPLDDQGAAKIATWLSYVGFTTLHSVQTDLVRSREKLVRVAIERVSNSHFNTVGAGISLMYLCYAILAERGPDPKKLLTFLQDNGFGPPELLPKIAAEIYNAFHK
jgi:putative GTP pyrophosphokinase